MQQSDYWIVPEWPAPKRVQALTTLRVGGTSVGPYTSFNLAAHVGDNPEQVLENRHLLKERAKLPSDPLWLMQVHGTRVVHAEDLQPENFAKPPLSARDSSLFSNPPEADAAISRTPGKVLAVLTADCLPILLCNTAGTEIAAIHAGHKGLAKGVIENTVRALRTPPEEIIAWLGPAIGPKVFEVGEDVRGAFTRPEDATAFQVSSGTDPIRPSPQAQPAQRKWLANIYELARNRLRAFNITQIFGGTYCTVSEPERFYSFRRSNATGRMASVIWIRKN